MALVFCLSGERYVPKVSRDVVLGLLSIQPPFLMLEVSNGAPKDCCGPVKVSATLAKPDSRCGATTIPW